MTDILNISNQDKIASMHALHKQLLVFQFKYVIPSSVCEISVATFLHELDGHLCFLRVMQRFINDKSRSVT